jgi:hypothetical protein
VPAVAQPTKAPAAPTATAVRVPTARPAMATPVPHTRTRASR